MLHAAVVPVHRHPVVQGFLTGKGFLILGIRVTQEIPGRTCPLGHGIRFPFRRPSAARAGGVHPVRHGRQGRLPVIRGLVGFHLRKHQGQLALVKGNETAFLTVHDGNGLPPVTLPGKYPVAELKVGLALSQALLLEPFRDLLLGIRHGQAVQEIRIHQDSGLHVCVHRLLDAHRASRHHFNDGQAEFLREIPVSLVMGRHRHNGPRPVGHEHIVGNPDGNLLPVHRIGGGEAVNLHACLVLCQLRTLEVGFFRRLLPVSHKGVIVFNLVFVSLNQRMLRGNYHIGGAEKRIRPGGVDTELLLLPCEGEIHFRTLGLADPVLLGYFDSFNVVNRVQALEQLIRVFRDLQHPLALYLADHLGTAALADAVHHFLVGQTHLAGGTPVDGHFRLVGQSRLKQFQEDPLGPFVIAGIRGVDLPLPVKGIAQGMELSLEAFHIVFGHDPGVDVIFDGIILRGKTKCVPAHGIEHVVALHPALAGHDVQGGVGPGVSHMKPLSRRVGEFYKCIVLRF